MIDYDDFDFCKKAADSGDVIGCFYLSHHYWNGNQTEKNEELSDLYWKKYMEKRDALFEDANSGEPETLFDTFRLFSYGCLKHDSEKDLQDIFNDCCVTAAEKGYAPAQCLAADYLSHEDDDSSFTPFIAPDFKKAKYFYTEAAKQGSLEAKRGLALLNLFQLKDVNLPDVQKNLDMLIECAEQGLAAAQRDVGNLYLKDNKKEPGIMWLEKAAALHNVKSYVDLKDYYKSEDDKENAIKWLKKLADMNEDSFINEYLFYLHDTGNGTREEYEKYTAKLSDPFEDVTTESSLLWNLYALYYGVAGSKNIHKAAGCMMRLMKKQLDRFDFSDGEDVPFSELSDAAADDPAGYYYLLPQDSSLTGFDEIENDKEFMKLVKETMENTWRKS